MESEPFEDPVAARGGEEFDAEDDGGDWAQLLASLPKASGSRSGEAEAFIPRRGDKDFAPDTAFADRQASSLAASREALFAALTAGQTRQHSSRYHNRATWHPSLARASMSPLHMHGIHFQSMGHHHQGRKRTELWPEEALYLVDRGNLECWTEEGVPMSAQQAWSSMVGAAELTLERYLVYSHLRRLGYVVLRAEPPEGVALGDSARPPKRRKTAATSSGMGLNPLVALGRAVRSLRELVLSFVGAVVRPIVVLARQVMAPAALRLPGARRRDLGGVERGRSLLSTAMWSTYDQIFSALQIIPTGHDLPYPLSSSASSAQPQPTAQDPWRVFYHVYRPITKVAKTAPPEPDFRMVVIDMTRVTAPDLLQLSALFDSLPAPEPWRTLPPRPRAPRPSDKPRPPSSSQSAVSSWSTWFASAIRPPPADKAHRRHTPRVNPFPRLKTGRRQVVVAAVDTGVVSFLRYGDAEFGEVSLVGNGKCT